MKLINAVFVASILLLAGCKTKPTETPPPPPAQTDNTGAVDSSAGSVDDTDAAGPSGELLSKRVIYFDFDRSEIRPEYATLIGAHAKFLAGSGAVKIRVEGHTDERGSREYNIALAERRAQAVRRALMLQGAGDAQLTTVSYGEERPAVVGSDESAYEKNRRV